MKLKTGRIAAAKMIFKHPAYLAIAAISSILFYYLFTYLIAANNYGIMLILVPMYLVYILVITSGIVLSVSIFTIAFSIAYRRIGALGSAEGILIPSIGGLVAGCGCSFPIIESVLLFFGVNVFEAAGIASAIAAYQEWIMVAMILANLAVIYYYLGRLSSNPPKRRR